MAINAKNDPAKTYTLQDFIDVGKQDELTYRNFSILRYNMQTEFAEQNILDYYLRELKNLCVKVNKITHEDIVKYKYNPDLLAYDIYGSTQLDFIILLCNGIIDPKEFDFKRNYLLLPQATVLNEFLSRVYNSESEWIDLNRSTLKESKKQ